MICKICPRCKLEMTKSVFNYVCSCGITYFQTDQYRWEISREENLYLWWNIKSNFCVATFNNKSTSLPWLPYNITEDKLKLYLTFS